MLRVKDIPNSYVEALTLLNGRSQRKISQNGWLVNEYVKPQSITLRLFKTSIVTWYKDGRIYLDHGGFKNRTTQRWINLALGNLGWLANSHSRNDLILYPVSKSGDSQYLPCFLES